MQKCPTEMVVRSARENSRGAFVDISRVLFVSGNDLITERHFRFQRRSQLSYAYHTPMRAIPGACFGSANEFQVTNSGHAVVIGTQGVRSDKVT